MRPYKQLLLNLLSDQGWEVVSRDTDTDWWAEEHWLIRSVRENWGQELILTFLVDPHYDGNNKGRAVWAVGANVEAPRDRSAAESGVALVPIAKGKLNKRLPVFVAHLNEHRHRTANLPRLVTNTDAYRG